MVSENINKDSINALGILNSEKVSNVFEITRNISDDIPGLAVNYEDAPMGKILEMRDYFLTDIDLVLVENLAADENVRTIMILLLTNVK